MQHLPQDLLHLVQYPHPRTVPKEKPVVKTRVKKKVAPIEEAALGDIMDNWSDADVDDE